MVTSPAMMRTRSRTVIGGSSFSDTTSRKLRLRWLSPVEVAFALDGILRCRTPSTISKDRRGASSI